MKATGKGSSSGSGCPPQSGFYGTPGDRRGKNLWLLALGFLLCWHGIVGGSAVAAAPGAGWHNLVAFTPALEKCLTAVSADGCELAFRMPVASYAQSRLAMVAVDSLLLAPAGRRFPDGLAGRVRGIRRRGDQVIVRLTPVTLTDLTAGGGGGEIALGPGDIEAVEVETPRPARLSTEKVVPGSLDRSAFRPSSENPVKTLANERPDGAGTPRSVAGRLRDSAVFSTGLRLGWDYGGMSGDARLKIENPVLVFRRDRLSFSGKMLIETGLGFRPARGLSYKQVLFSVRLKPIPLGFAGPVPLYVRPRLRVLVKGRMTGTIGFGGAFSFTAPFTAGVERRVGESWRNISTATVAAAEPRQIRLDGTVGELSAKLFAGVAVDFFINDLAGPTLRAGLFISPGAVATLVLPPDSRNFSRQAPGRPLLSLFKIKGGAELAVGGALGFLENASFLATVVKVEVPLYKMKLAGIVIDPPRLAMGAGPGIETAQLRLIPRYRQILLERERDLVSLGSLPGTWGVWDPPAIPGSDLLSRPPGADRQTFTCSLRLFDPSLAPASGTFDLAPRGD